MALQLEPPVPPPRRSVSTSCDLHPGETFTGFCAACLRERLSGLEASASVAAAPGRKSTSAIRSLFSRPFAAGGATSGAAAAPDLRRCKSFSCGRGGGAAGADEPQRRSCDVRGGRSTLWSLFHQDDRERVRDGTAFGAFPASSSAAAAALAAEVQPPPRPPVCVPEDFLEEEIAVAEDSDQITPVVEEPVLVVDTSGEMDTEATAARDVRAMKEHIDLESSQYHQHNKPPPKDLKEIAGSFWLAASVFSKKWQKWRRKQKLKKQESAAGSKAAAAAAAMSMPSKPSKPSFLRRSQFRGEAGSEFAGGRRSCDTDPRFSLDAGRMSVDEAGFSWDEPRASWDGYLFGAGTGIASLGRAPPPVSRLPPILSALEDSPAGVVERSDGQIPVEDDSQPEPDSDANVPGGSAQTRDYYMDSSSRRRRSLDRASSVRKSFEVTGPNPVAVPVPVTTTNGKESPLVGSSEFYHFHHAEDLLDHHRFSTNSLVEDFSASLETAFHGPAKKPRRWRKAWSLWGLIHRRAAGGRTGASDAADRAFSEPWPSERHGVSGYNGRMQRCNSNASARSSFSSHSGGWLGSSRRSCYVDASGHVKRRRGEGYCAAALERNLSARYSPGHAADHGMLRFYLTPVRSASGRQLRSQSFARTMLRLY